MEIFRKYGVGATVVFPLVDRDAQDFESTPVTFASNDTKIIKDEGAAVNTTNNPAHEGNGIYSLALTATEMSAARIAITIIDQTATKEWEDQAIILSTYGNAAAAHAFDLDTATQSVDVTLISGDSTAADNLEAYCDGTTAQPVNITEIGGSTQSATDIKDFADAGYDPATNKVQGVVLVDTCTTSTDMRGTDSALLAASAPANFGDMAITASTGKVTTGTNDDKTGYSLAQSFPANFADIAITASTGKVTVGTNDDKTGYDMNADQSGVTVGTVNALGTQAKADVNAEAIDVINVDANAELSSIPSTTSPMREQLQYIFEYFRNKRTVTSTTETLYKEDATTALGTSSVSDDGTTFTSGEMS